ncbi:MAG TPA: 4-hydroxyphenylpyruvate dioxygenase [Actinophytocola sp.]|jgi:4-hydroxymandelate synthase|uniref:4-hydroxyphenylpyruvate dioxygenase n=1 Tax=Actinophytocola sp. TaxID=1872138 RepID=UPI002F933486
MTTARTHVFENMAIDYVEFYVDDIDQHLDWLVDGYGCTVRAISGPDDEQATVRSFCVGQGDIDLVLTTPLTDDHPAAAYVERHGAGVANIGLRVPDATAAFAAAVRGGARPVSPPAERDGIVTATIIGFGDVTHTFVQRPDGSAAHDSQGLVAATDGQGAGTGLLAIDHFAVAVEPGSIDATVEYYQRALDFDLTLTERIEAGDQAMFIKVVQSKSRAVTLTLIEADVSLEPGHVDDFLKDHGGPGVQHMALRTGDILSSVRQIGERGVELLSTPDTYYTALAERVRPDRHSIGDLQALNILLDEDHDGQLYQIFATSVHPRNTIFLEIIERAGASTFGSSNIKNLYQAVETQRNRNGN